MYQNFGLSAFQGLNPFYLFLILVWSLIWKGYALWRASKNDQKYWFIVILIFNTIGFLEIIYLLFFQKKQKLFPILKKKLLKKI
jgi:hypothetical protein